MDDTARSVEILLARIDNAIDQHLNNPDPEERKRLQRYRREILLQMADERRALWGD